METVGRIKLESNSFGKRLKSMLKVDFRRMFTMPLLYIMIGVCLAMPILILVMTTMMGSTTMADPTTGVETTMDTFTNTWQAIGSFSSESSGMNMSLTGMCNINMLYFIIAVLSASLLQRFPQRLCQKPVCRSGPKKRLCDFQNPGWLCWRRRDAPGLFCRSHGRRSSGRIVL